MHVLVKEKSWLAKLAALVLKKENMAIVMGNCIHLWNADRHYFLSDKQWLRHEIVHVQQFRRHGFVWFICLYVYESLLHGYQQNKYETAARLHENDEDILQNITVD